MKNAHNEQKRHLRLTFLRAKLRRQMFMTRAEVWAKNWAKNWVKFSAHFRASFAVQNDPQIFSQNSSQFITACLVAEILKFHLRELLGFGGRNVTSNEKSPDTHTHTHTLLRWAKSRNSYRRIASESYRCNSNR